MDMSSALAFIAGNRNGVLMTIKADGRPQASNINYHADGVRVRISVTADRAKTANVRRDPRTSLHVTSADFWSWVVVEGTASLSRVASEGDDETAQTLRQLYRDVRGEHNHWANYDAAMIADRRQVLTMTVEHAYGQLSQ